MTTQTVRWTLSEPLAGGRFTVKLLDAAGHTRLVKRVAARSGVTGYSTRLGLSTAIRAGAYSVNVSSGSLSAVSARLQVVPERALRIAHPAGRARWRRGTVKRVAWTLYKKLTRGSFNVCLRSKGGRTYTLVPRFAPGRWTGRYSTRVALPVGVSAGAGYHLTVRWQDGASVLGGSSKSITVTR